MADTRRRELTELYRTWPDRRLGEAATTCRGDYQPEALELITAELACRGFTATELNPENRMSELERAEAQLARERACEVRAAKAEDTRPWWRILLSFFCRCAGIWDASD